MHYVRERRGKKELGSPISLGNTGLKIMKLASLL